MDQKWIYILGMLVFYPKMTSGAGETIILKENIKDGERIEISCTPSGAGTLIVWFRVRDKFGMEYIASFSNNGVKKSNTAQPSSEFVDSKIMQNILILKSFNKDRDSGDYSCGSLYKGVELKFGQVTRLVGEKGAVQKPSITTTTTKPSPSTTTKPCVCDYKGGTSPALFCTPLILGPLAGSCGLLLLLLIITTLYCNKMRTRRCPHHYKRKPRTIS